MKRKIAKPRISVISLGSKKHLLMEQIENLYTFTDRNEVRQYLLKNPDLLDILLNGVDEIKKVFGSNFPLLLEVHTDPEEDWDELFIIIKTDLSVEEVINKDEELFFSWFHGIIRQVGMRLSYTEEPL